MGVEEFPTADLSGPQRRERHALLRAGDRVGKYTIQHVLGEGGFGIVYQALQDEPWQRLVALKVIKPGMDSRGVIARFESERQSLAVMDHPHIAKVLDFGSTEEGTPFFAMEIVRGEPITDFCDKHRLGIPDRLELFIHVCEAVQHAHSKAVIHRDLKPSNILVEYANGRRVPKVIDFGVAKALNQPMRSDGVITEVGQLIGTPEYMSPEQAEMSGLDVDTRSDVYSLGVILYELLTGSRPFDSHTLRGEGYAGVQRLIRELDPERPSTKLNSLVATADRIEDVRAIAGLRGTELNSLASVLRRDLDWVVMKCLEKDRERRYETANALAVDVRRFLNDAPVLAGPPSASYRIGKFLKRNRVMVTAASFVVVAVLLGLVASLTFMLQANNERARAERAAAEARVARDSAAADRAVAEEVTTLIVDRILAPRAFVATGRTPASVIEWLNAARDSLAGQRFASDRIEAEVRSALARGFLTAGSLSQAENELRSAIRLRTNDLSPGGEMLLQRDRLALVQILLSTNRSRDALELLPPLRSRGSESGGLTLDPSAIEAYEGLAVALSESETAGEAIELFREILFAREALAQRPARLLTTRYNMALALEQRGDAAEAIRVLESVSAASASDPEALSLVVHSTAELARLQSASGLKAEAERNYLAALEHAKGVMPATHWRVLQTQVNLGALETDLGRLDQAIQRLEQACGLLLAGSGDTVGPRTLGCHLRLAVALRRADRIGRACDVVEQALSMPGTSGSPRTVGQLRDLRRELHDLGCPE